MSSFWNDAKDGQKFGNISWEATQVKFTEATIVKSDKFLAICGMFSQVTGMVNIKNKDIDPLPSLATYKVYFENDERTYDGKTKEYKATPGSKYLCKRIEELGYIGKPCKGMIDFGMPEAMAESLTTGKHGETKLEPIQIEMLESSYLKLEDDEIKSYSDSDVPKFSGGSGGYGKRSYGQTEAQRLQDRWEFAKTLLGEQAKDASTLLDLAAVIREHGEYADGVTALLLALLK